MLPTAMPSDLAFPGLDIDQIHGLREFLSPAAKQIFDRPLTNTVTQIRQKDGSEIMVFARFIGGVVRWTDAEILAGSVDPNQRIAEATRVLAEDINYLVEKGAFGWGCMATVQLNLAKADSTNQKLLLAYFGSDLEFDELKGMLKDRRSHIVDEGQVPEPFKSLDRS